VFGDLTFRLQALFRRSRVEGEMEEELRAHIERRAEDLMHQGVSRAVAERQARLEFGGYQRFKEEIREALGTHMLETILQDVRYGLRMLRKAPGFTAVAVLTLALGIGANTAIFSVVDAVLLRPLPYPQPDKLMMVHQVLPAKGVSGAGMSYPNFQDWARGARSFEELTGMRATEFALSGAGEARSVVGGAVTSGYFPMFRVKPAIGRLLAPSDDAPGAAAVVVLSGRLWQSQFGGDPGIVGKTILLDQHPFTVVGVVPGDFRPLVPAGKEEFWVPLLQDPIAAQLYQRRGGHYLTVVGRLKDGVTPVQAQADLQGIQTGLQQQYPDANKGWDARVVPMQAELVGDVRVALLVLLGAVGLVFLMACANVGSLQLVRATARQRELSIRAALGAGRRRLVQQLLAECVLLGVAGGTAGLLLAFITVRGMGSWLPADLPRIAEISVNGRMLWFGLALGVLSGIIFGLAPALHSSEGKLSEALKEGARSAGDGTRRRALRGAFVVVETALAAVLLIGSGLLIRSFSQLQSLDPGFNAAHLLTAGVSLPDSRYPSSKEILAFYNRTLERMKAVPGAQETAAAVPLPIEGGYINLAFQVEGRPAVAQSEMPTANLVAVSPNYFHVMQIRFLSGRELAESDSETAPNVCVISETVARGAFGGGSAMGKRISIGYPAAAIREIVGIVADVKDVSLASAGSGQVYVPFPQNPFGGLGLAIRTSGDAASLASAVRGEFHALDSALPVDALPMASVIDDSVTEPRFRTMLLGAFGAVALLLAAIGIGGVISYNTGLRTHEIGVRVALGAQPGDVMRLVVGQGMRLALAGAAIGLIAALGMTRLMTSLLFRVSATDPATFVAVTVVLACVAVGASAIPAQRAARVDPVVALRHE